MRSSTPARRVLLLLMLAVTSRFGLSIPDTNNSSQLQVKLFPVYQSSRDEAARLKAEPTAEPKATSEFNVKVELKKGEKEAPVINPMVSPRNRRNRGQAAKDSYLSALEYSHAIKATPATREHSLNLSKIARREYTPGPVYRPEGSVASKNSLDKADKKG